MKRRLLVFALAVLLIAAGAGALTWHRAIPPVAPPAERAFDAAQIHQGAELATIGDCAVCHTVESGRSYAGGRGVPTPFGTVYATNITPDPESGIGHWSLAAFERAMRDGIDREGHHLYPVLPYPHFTRATDADIAALYAFLMSRPPVRQNTPANRLPFPLNNRVLLAGWNLLYLKPGPWQPDPAHDQTWNRGAYLVEAVGHCGACHSPRNVLGAEEAGKALSGGEAENWYAPALQSAAQPWTPAALATYLRTGFHPQHGAAAGPMTAVTDALASVPATDIDAIATYIASLMPQGSPASSSPRGVGDIQATPMFAGACGGCHAQDAPMTRDGAPSLSVSAALNAPTPQSVIQVILRGIPWREGKVTPYMPAYADTLTDAQVATLASYLRAAYTGKPPWNDVASAVARARGTS